jgi:dGTPase
VLYGSNDGLRRATERDLPHSGVAYRSPYRRDYARLIHSPVFRRLQGKTQLFPGIESDFFRNRLTHSLEVAQVAKSIALKLNVEAPELKDSPIDTDLVEFAALAHDLGHPPFGHNGEAALDNLMKYDGGFEGNAQTFRILSRLEKKRLSEDAAAHGAQDVGVANGSDFRVGLNLAARSLAAVLKYDKQIPHSRNEDDPLVKGYYSVDVETVEWVRKNVIGESAPGSPIKTLECCIMDLADDIAYSTYDLEDTFKAGFLTPLELLSLDEKFCKEVAVTVTKSTNESVTAADVTAVLIKTFSEVLGDSREVTEKNALESSVFSYHQSRKMANNGYARTDLTSQLVGEFIAGVRFEYNSACPPLSRVYLERETLRKVETLKRLTFLAVIQSPRLKIVEYRGSEIVASIFDALSDDAGKQLLPPDFQQLYAQTNDKPRVICDFIAGMTDAYAVEFYSRLKSENATTIFKPF